MNEASKTKELWGEFEYNIISGSGIDIGCGNDPITKKVKKFDKEEGDASEITKYISSQFDFVFSCHCLEHMFNPKKVLKEWWQLVKPGGHLILIVPDEDLYEQGYFPSIFNKKHKVTFTISKKKSWSPKSYNVLDLVNSLENAILLKIQLQDNNYDRRMQNHSFYPRKLALIGSEVRKKMIYFFKKIGITLKLYFFSSLFRLPIDQTLGNSLAQIEVIIKKTG